MAATFVNVKIESIHFDAAENQEVIKSFAIGKKNRHNGKIYISYEEPAENGMPGTKSTLKLEPDKVTLTRSGDVEHKLEFQVGRRTGCDYRMPFGLLRMSVETKLLEIDLDEENDGENIAVFIEYTLMLNDELQGLRQLRIRVGEDRKVGH